jgi:prenyltransferase beta subunit
MVQVARLAPKVLGDSTPLVEAFFYSQLKPDGGFSDRSGHSDLYYTVFGLEGFLALQMPLPTDSLHQYVRSFALGDDLDLVHLACLARCWSALPSASRMACPKEQILKRVESCRSADGGYDTFEGSTVGTIYGTFMASGVYQDLQVPVPDVDRLVTFLRGLRNDDGGYQHSAELPLSLVPATAASVTLLRHLDARELGESAGEWLMSCFDSQGGFRAHPSAPMPDLLSTATALHALSAMKIDIGARKEQCLDFVDSLWTNRGGFFGHWEDSHVDCEYTYYGLLALGHLSF